MKRLTNKQILNSVDVDVVWNDLAYRVADVLLFRSGFRKVEGLLKLTKRERAALRNLRQFHETLQDDIVTEQEIDLLNLVRNIFCDQIAILVNEIVNDGLIAATFRNNHTGYHVYELELTETYSILPASYYDDEMMGLA